MSVPAIKWALGHPVQSATEKAILLVLANHANEYGISWPSQKMLAAQSACTDRTVRTVLGRLEKRGVIRRIARRRDNGSRQSDIILLEAFGARRPAPEGVIDDGGDAAPDHGERASTRSNELPGGNGNEAPHVPEGDAALEPSMIRKNSTLLAQAEWLSACLAVAGPGLAASKGSSLHITAIEIQHWIGAGCCLTADVLPVVETRTANPRPTPIRTWAYFTPAVLEAKARREAPRNHHEEPSNEPDRSTRRKAKRRPPAARDYRDAWDAAVEKANRAMAEQSAADAGGTGPDRAGGGSPLQLDFSREAE